MGDTLEAVMLVAFGCSWPLSVVKNIRSRTAKNMSLPFILLILAGYAAGIAAKLAEGRINYVLLVYGFNAATVMMNLLVFVRNSRLDKAEKKEEREMPILQTEMSAETEKRVAEYAEINGNLPGGGTVLFGGSWVASLHAEEFLRGEEPVYDRSVAGMSMDEACRCARRCIEGLHPSQIVLGMDSEEGDAYLAKYEWLLYTLHVQTKAELAVMIPRGKHAEAIEKMARSYGCAYVCLDSTEREKILPQLRPLVRNFTFGDAFL